MSINIQALIAGLPVHRCPGASDPHVHDVVEDSRRVTPGCLFVARRGKTFDGHAYIEAAYQAGAVAVLIDHDAQLPSRCQGELVTLRATNVGQMAGILAERVHGNPSKHLKVVGITGTNGKTTVAYLIQTILREAGIRFGMIGTIWCDDGLGRHAAALTTPSGPDISRHLGRMARAGYAGCAMEVSSHALDQGRVDAINFQGGVFTNLSGDHLDYHGSMEAYQASKAMLFAKLKDTGWGVLNCDDEAFHAMAASCVGQVVRTSTAGSSTCDAVILKAALNGTRMKINGPWGSIEAFVPVVGLHNTANVLQAAAAAWSLGVDRAGLERGLTQCHAPPGRLECVTLPSVESAPAVLVDYAHTDDALDRVMSALRPLVPDGGALRVVFGCGGDRDRSKRSRMGRVAAHWADVLYVTSDNPRTEDPQQIIDEICQGIPVSSQQVMQRDCHRATAIEKAIAQASDLDLVLIAGKGHETYQIIGTERHHFDDRETARNALATRAGVDPVSC